MQALSEVWKMHGGMWFNARIGLIFWGSVSIGAWRTSQLQHRKELQLTCSKVLCLGTHAQCKDTHTQANRASQLGFSRGTLISTEQTPQVMGMFSGCYLVLCGNEIASHLYHHPQTQEGPWPLLQQGPLRLPGDTNQLAAEKITLPGNWKHCKRNDWQEIGRSLKVWV